MRALPYDVAHLSFAQGASTFTEQVAKLLYLAGAPHSAPVARPLLARLLDGRVA